MAPTIWDLLTDGDGPRGVGGGGGWGPEEPSERPNVDDELQTH